MKVDKKPACSFQIDHTGLGLEVFIHKSWQKIAPFWPLKNLIAVNPLLGFEELKFEDALKEAHLYFIQKDLPHEIENINRETIKWLLPILDQGQATLKIPLDKENYLKSLIELISLDKKIVPSNSPQLGFLRNLKETPYAIIADTLHFLKIEQKQIEKFLTILLTTLPGWAAHVQYLNDWSENPSTVSFTKEEFLALRILITALIWPQAKEILNFFEVAQEQINVDAIISKIEENEDNFEKSLISKLKNLEFTPPTKKEAQLVFCIDVRSERIRKAIEAQGDYETLGFAGFFGIPLRFDHLNQNESFPSCPVLLKPKSNVAIKSSKNSTLQRISKFFKSIYKTLKYNFASPFALAESLGLSTLIWMLIRNGFPNFSHFTQNKLSSSCQNFSVIKDSVTSMSEAEKVSYAEGALKMMGLVKDFSNLIIFCGHGSTTENNAFASSLDCGACGGRKGGLNAQVLAFILNDEVTRKGLKTKNIHIPETTYFLGAIHDTTTDEIEIFDRELPNHFHSLLTQLKIDLKNAALSNCKVRNQKLSTTESNSPQIQAIKRAHDWAEIRPEWGLARNGAFIIGPRNLTKNIDLDGEAFLHSYDYTIDKEDTYLETILTAPVIVAEWINMQYFFSALDNVAFGAGSKITKNVAGKIGVMQGNASDLMHGLPLQSVAVSDIQNYHELRRLNVIVYAPKDRIDRIIQRQPILRKLFGNKWLHLKCINPDTKEIFKLDQNFERWT